MPTDDIKSYIYSSLENGFTYANSTETALRESLSWSKDKVTVFKRILARIKKGQGSQDIDNPNGKFVNLPLPFGKKYMTVFFEPRPKHQFYIYKIVIDQYEE